MYLGAPKGYEHTERQRQRQRQGPLECIVTLENGEEGRFWSVTLDLHCKTLPLTLPLGARSVHSFNRPILTFVEKSHIPVCGYSALYNWLPGSINKKNNNIYCNNLKALDTLGIQKSLRTDCPLSITNSSEAFDKHPKFCQLSWRTQFCINITLSSRC